MEEKKKELKLISESKLKSKMKFKEAI